MIKDTVISALAAGLILDKLSGYLALDAPLKISLWIALTVILIIFCLFLEIQAEKWRKRKRVQQLWQILEALRNGKEIDHGKHNRQVRGAAADNVRFRTKKRVG